MEDLGLALLLLTDLQHPVRNDLPHVRLDLGLNRLEVVLDGGPEAVVLPGQDVVQDPGVVDQDGVFVGPHVSDPDVLDALQVFHGEKVIHCGVVVDDESTQVEVRLWKKCQSVLMQRWLGFKSPDLKGQLSRILDKSFFGEI